MIALRINSFVMLLVGGLAFSNIFAFSLPGVGNSAYWSVPLIFGFILLSSAGRKNLRYLLAQKAFYYPIGILTFFALCSLIFPVIHKTSDLSMFKTWLNNLISYFAITFLSCLYVAYKNNSSSVPKFLITLYGIQSIFVIAMLLSPEIRDVIQGLVKTEASLEKMATYGGVRGLGLTSAAAFGFAVIMGFLALVFMYEQSINGVGRSSILFAIVFFILFLASISAGRTAIGGFGIGYGLIIISRKPIKLISGHAKFMATSGIFLLIVIAWIMQNEVLYEIFYKYSRYAFQIVYRYIETGDASYSSVNKLQTMYFNLSDLQFIFGDGRYTNADGTYYLHTDAGFMRFALIFGGLTSSLIYFSFLAIIYQYWKLIKGSQKKLGWFLLAIITLAFVYHYKGELILYNVGFMKCVYFFLISTFLVQINSESHHASTCNCLYSNT